MNKRWATVTIIVLLLIFIGYIVIDVTLQQEAAQGSSSPADTAAAADEWKVEKTFGPGKGQLSAVTTLKNEKIILGGELFIACYDTEFNMLWEYKPELPVTALAAWGDIIYAALQNTILVLGENGEKRDEWGPFETDAVITSVSVNESFVAFGDASNKKVFVLDKKGIMKNIIGRPEDPFILPSLYFDVALDANNNLYVANTGNRRIEKRKTDGTLISYFGEPGTENGAFCGCCNPAHFAIVPGGFVTAEKGLNRIKILNEKGEFVEFVSSANRFIPALPLDIASSDGKIIYGANPADSKLYIFKRK